MAEVKESKKEKRERKQEKKEKKEKSKKEKVEDVTSEQDEPAENGENSDSELEIDLNAAVPLSKKKQRLLKKGKLDLEKIAKKNPPPKPIGEESTPTSNKSPFGVWIGNLSFETTREDIIRWIVAKTADNDEDSVVVKEADVTRVNLPKKGNKIKGFAYVDLPSQKHVDAVVALSEGNLNGRNLLIKSSSSFEGRPEEHKNKSLSKNPPSRILFVGNLSFDTTDDLLEEHFRGCGKIVKVRMATFEDSGKCKGFAFIDFVDEAGPTAALKSKVHKSFMNRNLRMEYGEDRSKRNPKRQLAAESAESESFTSPTPEVAERPQPQQREYKERPAYKRPAERSFDNSNKRMKSSIALATAQRASAAIVPSQGKKKTFD